MTTTTPAMIQDQAFLAIRLLAELAATGQDEALTLLAEVAAELDTQTRLAVHDHRDATGSSWARIGTALGVTKQAAHQRFEQSRS